MKVFIEEIKAWFSDIKHMFKKHRQQAFFVSIFFLVLGIVLGSNA